MTKHLSLRNSGRWAPRESDDEVDGVLPACWDGKAVDDDVEHGLQGGRLMASTAAFLLTLWTTSGFHAFVPIRGCGDPGSLHDTKVYSETSPSYGITGCTKLYQPARAAELRAASAAKQTAQAKDTDGGGGARVRGRMTTDELGSNESE